jgi:hypothetical protein
MMSTSMEIAITILLITCSTTFVLLLRLINRQYSYNELVELSTIVTRSPEVKQIHTRYNKTSEFVRYILAWCPRILLGIIGQILDNIPGPRLYSSRSCFRYFSGRLGGKFPKRIYEGDSAQIILVFPWERPFSQDDQQLGEISFWMRSYNLKYPSLEVELQAAGLKISGDQQQNRVLRSLPAVYTWNVSAEKSGHYEVGIVTRFYDTEDVPPRSFVSTHKILVAKIGNLTGRQVWMITGTFGFVTAALGIIQALVSLKVIQLS